MPDQGMDTADVSNSAAHWDRAYEQGETTRGWYQAVAAVSLELVSRSGVSSTAAIVDIGAGASVLVDGLLADGYTNVTLVDQSPVALALTRERLAGAARRITVIEADVLTWTPPRTYALWHDRAVSHFLLRDDERAAYRATMRRATAPGSSIVLGAFGPDGPSMCAGLPVRRTDVAGIVDLLGPGVSILAHDLIDHVRPDGDRQQYLWVLARRD